jgi:Fe2+ or Zn2+ uptake regulation protein
MRTTKARTLIIDLITHAPVPIDSAQLVEQVRARDASIDRATVFRTVKTLIEHEKILRVDFGDGKARYESATHHHHHLICTGCGSIEVIDECTADETAQKQAQKKSFTITSHKLEYFGACVNCATGKV